MSKSILVLVLLGAFGVGAGSMKMAQATREVARTPRLERAWLTRQSGGWSAQGVCSGGTSAWPARVPVKREGAEIGAAALAIEAACAQLPVAP